MINEEQFKKEKKAFIRFLKEHGAYSVYKKNIKKPNLYNMVKKDHPDWSFDKIAKKYGTQRMITMLFVWDKTKEGYKFWDSLHKKWIIEHSKNFSKLK